MGENRTSIDRAAPAANTTYVSRSWAHHSDGPTPALRGAGEGEGEWVVLVLGNVDDLETAYANRHTANK